jgi:hypothetical protein
LRGTLPGDLATGNSSVSERLVFATIARKVTLRKRRTK